MNSNAIGFTQDAVQFSERVLLEVALALRDYQESVCLVGGWVPFLLLKNHGSPGLPEQHVGTIDIDLVIEDVEDEMYDTVVDILETLGFAARVDKRGEPIPFAFEKAYADGVTGRTYTVEVDLLGPEYGGTGRRRRHQRPQRGVLTRKVRGGDLVSSHYWTCTLRGLLPNGAAAETRIRVADVVASVVMKAFAIRGRTKPKDYYDLYMLVRGYKEGPRSVANEMKPLLQNNLVREAIVEIMQAFRSRKAFGPVYVADAMGDFDGEARDRRINDVFFTVRQFLRLLLANHPWGDEKLEKWDISK